MKTCSKCRELLPDIDFGQAVSRGRAYTRAACIDCEKKSRRERHKTRVLKNAFIKRGIPIVPVNSQITANKLATRVGYSRIILLDDVTNSHVVCQNAAIRSGIQVHLRRAYRLGYYASRYSESRDENPYTRYGAMSRRLAWYQGYDDCITNGDRP